jgi:mannose-6-phosphate isomerase
MGLQPGTTREALERYIAENTVDSHLPFFVPKPGDCVMVPAGTVHAAGGGVVLAEVQQSSDATFRLYDWGRLGSDGKPRPLHVSQALESIDWNAKSVPVIPAPPADTKLTEEKLVSCQYFNLSRVHLRSSLPVPSAGKISMWMVLSGSATLERAASGYRRLFRRGETVLVPASATGCRWTPTTPATLLAITLS